MLLLFSDLVSFHPTSSHLMMNRKVEDHVDCFFFSKGLFIKNLSMPNFIKTFWIVIVFGKISLFSYRATTFRATIATRFSARKMVPLLTYDRVFP